MADYNYSDALSGSSQLEYQSRMHDTAVEQQGRKTYVFLLDRDKTERSEIYSEAVNGRIYLPHFEQRALYNTNEWTSQIGLNNFMETEEALSVEYNFARMVRAIRDLKVRKAGELAFVNRTGEVLHLSIESGRLLLRSRSQVALLDLELSDYRSIGVLMADIRKKCSVIEVSYSGDMEKAENLSSVSMKLYPGRKEGVPVDDRTYGSCGDVILEGDVILTDRHKLYQVVSAAPSGLMLNEYISWKCQCKPMDLALANLPDDYRKIVARSRYGLPKAEIGR